MPRLNDITATSKAQRGSVRKRKRRKYGEKAAEFAEDIKKTLWIGIICVTCFFLLPLISSLFVGFITSTIQLATFVLGFLKSR